MATKSDRNKNTFLFCFRLALRNISDYARFRVSLHTEITVCAKMSTIALAAKIQPQRWKTEEERVRRKRGSGKSRKSLRC
jgi:hypothetical protein